MLFLLPIAVAAEPSPMPPAWWFAGGFVILLAVLGLMLFTVFLGKGSEGE